MLQHGEPGIAGIEARKHCELLAAGLGVGLPMISLQRGMSSRRKTVRVVGVTASEAETSLGV